MLPTPRTKLSTQPARVSWSDHSGAEPLLRRQVSSRCVAVWLLLPAAAIWFATAGAETWATLPGRVEQAGPTSTASLPGTQLALPQEALALAIDESARNSLGVLREGTLVQDELGRFHRQEGRIIFRSMLTNNSWIALENLNLERVAISLQAAGGDQLWSVTGELTEFQGDNYLLIRRAVKKGPQSLAPLNKRVM